MNNNNESIAVFNDQKIGTQYASFSPDSMPDKVKLYNAINTPDEQIADFINKEITIADVVIRVVTLTARKQMASDVPQEWVDENTDKQGYRVIIIDGEGKSYSATSNGIYNSICTLRGIFGTLHFDEPLRAKVNQIKTKNGNTLTLSLI